MLQDGQRVTFSSVGVLTGNTAILIQIMLQRFGEALLDVFSQNMHRFMFDRTYVLIDLLFQLAWQSCLSCTQAPRRSDRREIQTPHSLQLTIS